MSVIFALKLYADLVLDLTARELPNIIYEYELMIIIEFQKHKVLTPCRLPHCGNFNLVEDVFQLVLK